jgi:hypothetical protein
LAVKRSDLSGLFKATGEAASGAAWLSAKWLADYRVRRLFADAADPAAQFDAVSASVGDKKVALTRAATGAWTFATPPGYGEADDLGDPETKGSNAPFTGVRPLLNFLTGLQSNSPKDYLENPGDLNQYGLAPTDPNRVRIELKPKAGPAEVAFLGKAVEEGGKPVVPAAVFAQLEGDPAVIKVSADRMESLRQTVANPGELRNRDLIPASRRDRIDALDLAFGPTTVKLRKVPAGEGLVGRWVLYGGPEPADARSGEVEALLTSLARPRAAQELLTAPNDAAFAPPDVKAVVKVWVDGVDKPEKAEAGKLPPEPKLKGEPTELTFGKTDGGIMYVRRKAAGGTTDLKVPEGILGFVTKGRLDYLDPNLKSFSTLDATRLSFNRGAEPVELEAKDGAKGEWAFVKPDARKGQPAEGLAVSRLLGLLSGLYPDRVVAENPGPDDLKKLGLEPPRMRVTVALKNPADKERVYDFGTDTDDKKFVYARQAGRPYVFLMEKGYFDRFAGDDLRDLTLYRLDVAKVARLRVRGWKEPMAKEPQAYQFVKKDGNWVLESPAGKTADPAKVNALVNALAAPRADSYTGGGPKGEYGTDVGANPEALEFTIEPEGAAAVVLILGNKAATPGTVYGISSAVPNAEAFVLPAGPIKALTEKPTSLLK